MDQTLMDAQYPIITIPFNGNLVPVKIRELTQAQIYSCGGSDMSLIETFQDKIRMKRKPSLKEICLYADMLNSIAKLALVSPTYGEVFTVCKLDADTDKNFRAELKEIEALLAELPTGPKKTELANSVLAKRAQLDLVIPDDFLNSLVTYALGTSKSDIKLVTEDMLYNAAISAKLCNDSPCNHLDGAFSPFNKEDINRRALQIYAEKRKDK